jgi:hypothetical protein
MKIRLIIFLSIFFVLLVDFSFSLSAVAAPPAQQFATNTPLPDGRILYKIQPADTCIRIGLLNNISVEQLRKLNTNINSDCSNLQEGTLLLIGIGGSSVITSTPGPSPTPLPPTITPTPLTGTAEICVLLFNDINGDGLHQDTEPVIVGGVISVTEINGRYSKTSVSSINPDPNAYPGTCFVDVPEGNYNIGVAIPDNYNPTTKLNYALTIKAGESDFVPFGAQARDASAAQPGNTDGGSGLFPLLGFFGGLLLLGGLALGFYALRLRAPESKLKRSGLLKK